jgi:hypothetical protein
MAGLVSPAQADSTSLVTQWEYDHVYIGDTKAYVEQQFDNSGAVFNKWQSGNNCYLVKDYYPDWKGPNSDVLIEYVHDCGTYTAYVMTSKTVTPN